jgi:ACS family hexuronate transporter-like MFS transporter
MAGETMTASPRVAVAEAPEPERGKLRHLRWYICGLLFLATTINYLDRQATGVLNPILREEIGWDDAGFGWVMFAFQLAYAIMFPISGRLLDLFGVRRGLFWAVIVWSVAAMAHALARSTLGFAAARFALGIGEAANFPASIKAIAEWFPKHERALATGIFNSGTNVGVMLSPMIVWLAVSWHWQAAFIVTGLTGLFWLFLWQMLYRSPEEHPRLTAAERALITKDADAEVPAARVPWTAVLRFRQAWAVLLGKGLTDPVWWFYLFWLPTYLNRERGVSALTASVMLLYPYIAADIGSIGGGWLSGFLIKRGWPVGKARLFAMGLFAACMPGAIWAVLTNEFWLALTLISLATSAHQAWSANIFTLASDMFPKTLVGSVVGLAGMSGAIGGMFMTLIAGCTLQWTGSYVPLFVLAGLMHPLGFGAILLFGGHKLQPVDLRAVLKTERSRALILAGGAMTAAGVVLALLVGANWDAIVAATRSLSAAAQGLTASVGLGLVGLTLLYAGRGKSSPTAQA